MKSLLGLTWDLDPHTSQDLGLETAMILLSHGVPSILAGQFMESLVTLSDRHLKNLCCLLIMISIWIYGSDIKLFPEHYSLLLSSIGP